MLSLLFGVLLGVGGTIGVQQLLARGIGTDLVATVRARLGRGEPLPPLWSTAAAPPPIVGGWHTDPSGVFEYRYHDGAQWTEHVSSQGEVTVSPLG